MSRISFIPDAESRARAIDPDASIWVSANAGAGKTSLLRDRVIRLLIEGVSPDRILCLTFTRAAAAEMQTRIFDELASWSALSDAALLDRLARLRQTMPAPGEARFLLRRARQLFAEAVETPGGLKIQTIHAFAERILHLFPIEAGVPVDFSVLETEEADLLHQSARVRVFEAAARATPGRLAGALDILTQSADRSRFSELLQSAMSKLRNRPVTVPALPPGQIDLAYETVFGQSPDATEEALRSQFLAEFPDRDALRTLVECWDSPRLGSRTQQMLERFRALSVLEQEPKRWMTARDIVFTLEGKPRSSIFSADLRRAVPAYAELEQRLLAAGESFRRAKANLLSAQRSAALHHVAAACLEAYSQEKDRLGVLDFDDLIRRLAHVLADGRAAWVMRKLDSAIDHVLIDEAQDTSRPMWEIIGALTGEFFAGESQGRRPRSLFVVGDEKQSIFSFQGAEPSLFDEKRQHFAQMWRQAGLRAERVSLNVSFRSSQDVLTSVDHVFREEGHRVGLGETGAPIEHIAARQEFPGHVECWPIEEKAEVETEVDPDAPVDQPKPSRAFVLSAERIAATIARWLKDGERHLSDRSLVLPGDILILVRKRDGLFAELIKALNRRRLPVAGADRLNVLAEIGVKDLIALAQAVLVERDDLSLAAVLKSPLVGLSDAELEPLCRARSGSLRQEIRNSADLDPRWQALDAWLERWRGAARHLAPFDFFSQILAAPSIGDPTLTGRMAMLTRLGPDAADAIDTFLTDALAFAHRHPGSLPLFLAAQSGREREIKRDLDAGNGRIRIMTVHASKGLEARIVIVAGAAAPAGGKTNNTIYPMETPLGPLLLWAGRQSDQAELLAESRERAADRAWEEYRRLLYVAMTRAKERLIIASHRHGSKPAKSKEPSRPDRRSWHEMVEWAMKADPEVARVPDPTEPGRVILRRTGKPVASLAPVSVPMPAPPDLDRVRSLLKPLAQPLRKPRVLRPSGASAEAGTGLGRLRGMLTHRLFERLAHLPVQDRPAAGAALLAEAGIFQLEQWLSPVLHALEQPSLRIFFEPPSRPEVPLAGVWRAPDGAMETVRGRVDWLRVTPGEVLCLDLKSGNPADKGARAGYLRQMGLYRVVLADLFPGRTHRAYLLWTRDMQLDELAPAALEAALERITKQ
jgi:ATP-dependent helicase/nuclease subunit A